MIVLRKNSYLRSTWKDARGEERGRAHFERALATGGFWSVLSVPISSNLGISVIFKEA